MATNFPPPPTYASPIIEDARTKKPIFNPVWLNWFLQLATLLSNAGGGAGFFSHNDLTDLQGGTLNEFFHLSEADYDFVHEGPSQPPDTPVVDISPWAYQNVSGFTQVFVLEGGTLTDVAYSRDGATWTSAGTSRILTVGRNDYVQVTYAVAPIATTYAI